MPVYPEDLVHDGPASLPPPTGDPQAAYQAFLLRAQEQQAMLNALAFNPRGALLDLRAQQLAQGTLSSMSLAWTPLRMGPPLQNFLAESIPLSRTPEEQAAWEAAREAAQVAERRAFALLEAAIGVDAAAKVAAGGGYEIPSRRMSGRLKRRSYLVPREGRVKILQDGLPVGESCIVSDAGTPWPDQVLHKIKAIQADETVVFATGNVTMHTRRH